MVNRVLEIKDNLRKRNDWGGHLNLLQAEKVKIKKLGVKNRKTGDKKCERQKSVTNYPIFIQWKFQKENTEDKGEGIIRRLRKIS